MIQLIPIITSESENVYSESVDTGLRHPKLGKIVLMLCNLGKKNTVLTTLVEFLSTRKLPSVVKCFDCVGKIHLT